MFPSGLETRNPPSPIGDEEATASGATDVADSGMVRAVWGSAPKCVASDTSPPDTPEEDKGNRPPPAPAHRPARLGSSPTKSCAAPCTPTIPAPTPPK